MVHKEIDSIVKNITCSQILECFYFETLEYLQSILKDTQVKMEMER